MNNLKLSSKLLKSLKLQAGKATWDWTAPEKNVSLADKIAELAADKVGEAYRITDKVARKEALSEAKEAVVKALTAELAEGEELDDARSWSKLFGSLEKKIVRGRIIAGEKAY